MCGSDTRALTTLDTLGRRSGDSFPDASSFLSWAALFHVRAAGMYFLSG